MDQILKALNDALENKEYQIKWLNNDIDRVKKERDELLERVDAILTENEKLKDRVKKLESDLAFYEPKTAGTEAVKEDF